MNQRLVYACLIFLLVLGFAGGLVLLQSPKTCPESLSKDATVSIGKTVLFAQVAKTEAQREAGLSGKKCLAKDQAMLFLFNKPGYYPFWMRDMRFPLDIVWINPSGYVTDIEANLQPNSYPTTFTNTAPANKVLELGGGQAAKLHLRAGDYVHS